MEKVSSAPERSDGADANSISEHGICAHRIVVEINEDQH